MNECEFSGRYDLDVAEGEAGMEPSSTGEWVRFEDYQTLALKLSAIQKELDEADATVLRLQFVDEALGRSQNKLKAAEGRLDAALKFVSYIAKRYEEGWDEPVTERFYNEAKALLVESSGNAAGEAPTSRRDDSERRVVERQEIK